MPYNSLRPVREKKGMTIAQLAGKSSISIRTLQAYESGDRAIAPDDLRKLARVLYASASEILEPSIPLPAPPPPPRTVAPAPVHEATPAAPPVVNEVRQSSETRPAPDVRRPPGGRPSPGRPSTPRPPREASPSRQPGPATPGQIDQIRNISHRLGIDDAALVERIGSPLEALNHFSARAAITALRKDMEESGTWQPKVVEGPDHEGEYLGKLHAQGVPLDVRLINGERFQGPILDYTSYVIRLRDSESGAEVSVRKLAIAYYQTQGPVDDTQ